MMKEEMFDLGETLDEYMQQEISKKEEEFQMWDISVSNIKTMEAALAQGKEIAPKADQVLLSSSFIQRQSVSGADFFNNNKEMLVDEETPNSDPAGVCERIGVRFSERYKDEVVETNSTIGVGFCDEYTSQFDVTTYDAKDLLKMHAECHTDFMQQKSSKEDISGSKCSKCISSSPSTGKSCSNDCEKDGYQILNPLLPSHFHDNTKPNTILREKYDEIAKAHIRQFLNRNKRASSDIKYKLRSAPPEMLTSHTLVSAEELRIASKEKPKVKYSEPFDSLVTLVKHYENYLRSYKKYWKDLQGNKPAMNLSEDNPIADVLNELKCSLSEDLFNKQAIPSVIKILTNREIMPDKTYFLYYVFHYIYVLGSSSDSAYNFFSLLPYEKVVLSSLFKVDEMKKPYLNNLMARAVESLHLLIVTKPMLVPKGIFALCRVFTEICRKKNLVQKPVSLAIDLLKKRHRHSTVIIACMVSVWSEPFMVTEASLDEEKCLWSALVLGTFKSCHSQYLRCHPELKKLTLKILEKHFTIPDYKVLEEVIDFLFAKIHQECDRGTLLDVENILLAPILIVASCSQWNWTRENILEKHIIPGISKYEQEQNETGFGAFTDFYAETFAYSSLKENESLLKNYLKDKTISEGNKFVKDCATASYLRFLLGRKRIVIDTLLAWLQGNVQNSNINVQKAESLIRCVEKSIIKKPRNMRVLGKEDF